MFTNFTEKLLNNWSDLLAISNLHLDVLTRDPPRVSNGDHGLQFQKMRVSKKGKKVKNSSLWSIT